MQYQHLQFAQYRTTALLGEGGMGSIYQGYDEKLQRHVAIKVLKANAFALSAEQLHQEARMLAQINHENVMQIFELATTQQELALVGEYIDGQPLSQYIKSHALALDAQLNILVQIAEGMTAVHNNQVIHGDLTLENVLVTHNMPTTQEPQVKIIDFGLAVNQQVSLPNAVTQTQCYASIAALAPEHITSLNSGTADKLAYTKASDLFAFGTLAFQVLSGDKPFSGKNEQDYMQALGRGEFSDPANIFPTLPSPIITLLRQLLSCDPKQRPASFEHVVQVFSQCLRGLAQQKFAQENTVPLHQLSLSPKSQSQPHEQPLEQSPDVISSRGKPILVKVGVIAITCGILLTIFASLWQQTEWQQTAQSALPTAAKPFSTETTANNANNAKHDSINYKNRHPERSNTYYVALHRPVIAASQTASSIASAPDSEHIKSQVQQQQQEMVLASLDHGLRQAILRHKHLHLMASSELPNATETMSKFMQRSSAHLVLQPQLSCTELYCRATLTAHLKPTPNNPLTSEWLMSNEQLLTHELQLFNHLTHWLNDEVAPLMPEFPIINLSQQQPLVTPTHELQEQDFLSYLQIYTDVNFNGNETQENLQNLTYLLQQSPHLYSAYAMHRRISLNLFRDENKQQYIEQLKQLLRAAPTVYRNSVAFSIDNLWIALYQRQFAQAETLYKQAQQRGADRLTLLELRATVYLQQNLPERAIPEYQQALALRFSTRQLFNLALAYWYIGDYQQVSEQLEQLLQVATNDYAALQLLSSVYLISGRIPQAIQALHNLTEENPQSMDLNNLAIAYSLDRNFVAAQKYAQQAVALSPQQASWLLNLADIHWYLGEKQIAEQTYRQVLNIVQEHNDLDSMLLKAQAWLHLEEHHLAITTINEATKLAPDNGEVAYISALISTQLNELTSATVKVETALNAGIGHIWFQLPWFDALCSQAQYRRLFSQHNHCAIHLVGK